MLAAHPWLTLVPPLAAIVLVIATRRVVLSLGTGIIVAGLLLADFNPLRAVAFIGADAFTLVWDGGVNWYTILIVLFLFQLGVLTSVVMMAGGASAFSEWAAARIRTRRGAQVLAATLGMIIFIDDYFNALAVGQVARPITDRYRVSRAKLAYLIDSSSAPVVVLVPFSSWGATIMGIMAPIVLVAVLGMSQVEAFMRAAVMNYYAIGALVLLWLVALLGIDFGPMRTDEIRAEAGGGLYEDGQVPLGQFSKDVPSHEPGSIRTLLVPFAALVVGVITGMYVTGGLAAGSWGLTQTLAEADVALSLVVGGTLALVVAVHYYVQSTKGNPVFVPGTLLRGMMAGARSMALPVLILLFAWVLAELIGSLGTGPFLASLVEKAAIPAAWLIPVLFVIAGVMAFATGTSWGSFGILLPLAGEMMNAVPGGTELLLPSFGAVLAGAVWGDHCSPISDTTILSSTGAGCPVPTHVSTQLPYAIFGALAALAGYVAYALTVSAPLGLAVTVLFILIVALVIWKLWPSPTMPASAVAAG